MKHHALFDDLMILYAKNSVLITQIIQMRQETVYYKNNNN
jgi:hypothetical protein